MVTLFWRRLHQDFVIASDLRVDGGLTVLLLLGIVRGLRPLLLPLHQLDGHLLVRFNLLVRYYLRKRRLQLQGVSRVLTVLDRIELFQVFGRLMHREQLDLLLLQVVGCPRHHLLDVDLFNLRRRLLGRFNQRRGLVHPVAGSASRRLVLDDRGEVLELEFNLLLLNTGRLRFGRALSDA